MGYITVSAEVHAEDILDEIGTADLVAELKSRAKHGEQIATTALSELGVTEADRDEIGRMLDNLYLQFRDKPDTPQFLRDLIWHTRGRVM